MEEIHNTVPQKINVWCGIIGRYIVGPFLINGNLTSDKYLKLLQQSMIPRQIFPNYENPNLSAESMDVTLEISDYIPEFFAYF